jgi:Putative transposase
VIYTLLFRAAADTLLTFGRDPHHLGGTIGITAMLHTWGQTLSQHLHVHCLVTGGALAATGSRWITGRSSFLFPVRALATVFRAKYLTGLHRAFDSGALTFAGGTAALADRRAFVAVLGQLRAVDWIVYAKRPFAGPEQVLAYLGRYTHRVALSNDRLIDHHDGRVRFRWKDYADHDRVKVMTLDVDEFLRRFLLHVVPRGFMRIRHFGLLANRTRRCTVARCRDLLSQPPPEAVRPESVAVLMQRLTGVDLSCCPVCREGRMQITAIVARVTPVTDSS